MATLLLGIIAVTVLYIQKDILIHVALKGFFFPPIEMGLVDNSILFPIKALALKCTDKYYEVSI